MVILLLVHELNSRVIFVLYEDVDFSLEEASWFAEEIYYGGSKGGVKVAWVKWEDVINPKG